MRTSTIALLGIAAVASVTAASVATTSAATTQASTPLTAKVDDNFHISLKRAGGKALGSVKPGSYTITVRDNTAAHDFHLTGPGVNRKTSVGGTRTTTWTVTFAKGTYRYQCDVHAMDMHGSFKVA